MIKYGVNDCIVYDVEVINGPDDVAGGWANPALMGFATAVAYDYLDDSYRFYEGSDGHTALIKHLNGRIAVTFNGINFDSRVLLGNDRQLLECGVVSGYVKQKLFDSPGGRIGRDYSWYNFDLLLEYIRARFGILAVNEAETKLGDKTIHDGSFNLDGLAAGTLNMRKNGHGAHAPVLYRQQKFAELYEYNLHDVRLTRKLFDFVCAHGYVVDREGRKVKILDPLS